MRCKNIIISSIAITLSLALLSSNISNSPNISALEYSNDTNLEFTFNPTLNLSISGNLSIDNLTPGSSSDSNIIDVNISTNNVSGYNLSATVGSSNNATTNLTNTSNSNYTFISLTSDTTNLTDFNPNTWGYSYSVDNGTTWSNYSGLPLYTSTPTLLFNIYNPSEDTINFKIGAKASSSQPSGEYTNTVNFIAVGNPEVRYYMQEFTNSICEELASDDNYTVYDIRDGSDYTVRYINGACWMTQNLRITGAISSKYSNFEGEDFNVSEYSLDSSDPSYVNHCDSTNGYNYACSKYSGNSTAGSWYNYCATSAGTICDTYDSNDAVSDICPTNWHLPASGSVGSQRPGTFYSIKTINPSIFSISAGGYYDNGIVHEPDTGTWWSSTNYNNSRKTLYFKNGGLNDGLVNRRRGLFIRCVRSS